MPALALLEMKDISQPQSFAGAATATEGAGDKQPWYRVKH